MNHLLIVEDAPEIASSLAEYLRGEGYRVDVAPEGRRADFFIERSPPDLIILDWMLPGEQGIDLLRRWRMNGVAAPVIFLSARADTIDKVLALELGADDYLTKPFEPRELLARIRVRLRQQHATVAAPVALVCGGLRMVIETREVTWGGQPLQLTPKAFDLLRLFLENPNRVFTRDEILNSVWGYDSFPTTRTVDTHVLQLRQKTDSALFESIRGVGYRLKPPVEKKSSP